MFRNVYMNGLSTVHLDEKRDSEVLLTLFFFMSINLRNGRNVGGGRKRQKGKETAGWQASISQIQMH